ncbi:hypothetical protein SASPL_124813 [Salvia splendens]|uniref:SEL1 protein n=1 Tax=Salvia splendens TaxID=180675 RepID=A0A8X8XFZ8_SALSN|nr:hypothetical protein SASPL_124813 [Salvia splendens]
MFKVFRWKPAYRQLSAVTVSPQFNLWRGMHSRSKKAMELIAKGYSALQEVDRVIDYCERGDQQRVIYVAFVKTFVEGQWGYGCAFKAAKQNFELALEADNSSTHARYWLSKMHLKYLFCPGANKAVGAALLVEAAEMGNPDALYDLGCRLRAENPYAQSVQQAFYYLEKAVDQLHPGALYLLGAVYLTGDCVSQDISSAIWCFHRASEKVSPAEVSEMISSGLVKIVHGHAASAIAYGSLLLAGVRLPESVTKFNVKKASSNRKLRNDSGADEYDPVEMARDQFEIAANAGCDLGLKWLKLLDEDEKKKTGTSS